MKHFFVVTTIYFFTLSLYAVDSRLELPKVIDSEEAAYKGMQSNSSDSRAAGLAYLAERDSDLLKKLQVIKDVEGDLLCKEQSHHPLQGINSSHLKLGLFVLLHEGNDLPQEFYPCIIFGRTARPTPEELKKVYMPYTFLNNDDRARSEGSDDSDAVSDGDESPLEKEDERPLASEVSEGERSEDDVIPGTKIGDRSEGSGEEIEDSGDESKPWPGKRKAISFRPEQARKRCCAVIRRNSVVIPCRVGAEMLIRHVSNDKVELQINNGRKYNN